MSMPLFGVPYEMPSDGIGSRAIRPMQRNRLNSGANTT